MNPLTTVKWPLIIGFVLAVVIAILIYGGVNRGVKAGSFNAPLLGAYLGSGLNQSLPYKAETLYAYETGFKSTFLDGHARFNAAAFYYDYKNYQAFLFVGVGGVVINADSHNVGAEMELQLSPAKGLDIILSGSWFNAIVEDIPLRFGSPLPPRDVKPTYSPPVTATAMARYEWEMPWGLLHVMASGHYVDKFYYNSHARTRCRNQPRCSSADRPTSALFLANLKAHRLRVFSCLAFGL